MKKESIVVAVVVLLLALGAVAGLVVWAATDDGTPDICEVEDCPEPTESDLLR